MVNRMSRSTGNHSVADNASLVGRRRDTGMRNRCPPDAADGLFTGRRFSAADNQLDQVPSDYTAREKSKFAFYQSATPGLASVCI